MITELIIQCVVIFLFGVLTVLSSVQHSWTFAGINGSLTLLYLFLYLGKYIFK